MSATTNTPRAIGDELGARGSESEQRVETRAPRVARQCVGAGAKTAQPDRARATEPRLSAEDGERVQCWLLRRREDLMLSTAITFTPWGIVLQGDLTPSTIGDVSRSGYGVGWFGGQLGGDYLCGKFGLDSESAAGCWLIAIQRAFAREYAKRAVPAGSAG